MSNVTAWACFLLCNVVGVRLLAGNRVCRRHGIAWLW